ncbi:MAG: ABC transporter ATP-binding protein [Planctomycetes bacterium]|nr:ABC transporter ATP-binding protein [Planctomycetota bacterium]
MARVLLEDVTKVFDGGVTAVSRLSLDVADHEFMVIVGPSGCGKTTTLRVIAGLERPTAGNIYIGDTLVNDLPARRRDVAMVFQNYALYPHMTVYQNLAFALTMRRLSAAEINKRIGRVAGLLAIEQLLARKPQALSGGQRQRVALGRAIVRSPKVFLFDEPLSNLDAALRISTRAEIKALHHRLQTACIYVTHDQAEAMTLGDQICVMVDGAAQQTGEPLGVYERPINRFVAGFLGTPAMNFFTGRLDFQNDAVSFVIGNDTITLGRRLKTLTAAYRNREMVLGIRPENLSLSLPSKQSGGSISAVVSVVEPLGNRTDVHLRTGAGDRFIVSIDPHIDVKPGDGAKIRIDPEKVHIFEPGPGGKNVTLPDTAD